ncbi:MAG: glycosyltransferase [Herbiconiux sp.]|nr:glycosyltransferase [Herbiconiux sp.]
MSLRVALVSLHTSPLETPGTGDAGGLNVFVVGLADALTAAGVETEILTRRTGAATETPDARTPGGAPVRFLAAGPLGPVPKNDLVGHLDELTAALRTLPRFDVVHSNYWLSGLAGLPAAEGWGAPHVLSLHTVAALKNENLAPGDRPEAESRLAGERMLAQASDLTVAHTRAERDAVHSFYGVPAERLAVVPPGVDTQLFHPGPPDEGQPFVLVLARIQPLKGVELALEAVASIREADRPLLVVAGGTSPGHEAYAAGLLERAAELGLEVRFLPAQSRPDTADLLRRAALLLVPSHSETFGLVALEAAASGTPVVAYRTSGLTESVVDGVSGMLLPSRDPRAWGEAIRGLLADRERRATLSIGALEHGRSRSWPTVAREVASLYEGLIAGRIDP